MVFEGEHPICLFVTGRQHAGENLDDIIDYRDETLEPIMQMSDGLAANRLKNNDSIWSNCIIHGRRNFIDIESVFPEKCHYAIGKIYHHEAQIKEQGLNAQQRLEFHQKHSRPIMDEFKAEMQKQLNEHWVEENSRLGGAYIADVIISLVETCRMNGQNPEDYLRMLMKNKSSVFAHPEQWLPWNYKDIEDVKKPESRPPAQLTFRKYL